MYKFNIFKINIKIVVIIILLITISLSAVFFYYTKSQKAITNISFEKVKTYQLEKDRKLEFKFKYYQLIRNDKNLAILSTGEEKLEVLDNDFNIVETYDLSFAENPIFSSYFYNDTYFVFQTYKIESYPKEDFPENMLYVFDLEKNEVVKKQKIEGDRYLFYMDEKFFLVGIGDSENRESVFNSTSELNIEDFSQKALEPLESDTDCNSNNNTNTLTKIYCIIERKSQPIYIQKNYFYFDINSNTIKALSENKKEKSFEVKPDFELTQNISTLFHILPFKDKYFALGYDSTKDELSVYEVIVEY